MKTTKELLTQLAFVIIVALCSLPTAQAQSQENLVDRVSKAVGVTLPDGYQGKVKEYVNSSKVLEGSGGEFTEQFIKGQMKENWGISKQNQLLFIWDAIYEQVTKKNFYDGEDGNKQRLDDFENALDNVEACGKKYKQGYMEYMQRQLAETRKGIIQKDSLGLKEMVKFYSLFIKNPNNVKNEEIERSKYLLRWVIPDCKKYNIDYKAILCKELGEEKKVNELLKFYGIE